MAFFTTRKVSAMEELTWVCMINIKLAHWEKLKEYWSKPKTSKKAEQMLNVRNKVTNLVNVGQLGKVGKEPKLVCELLN